MDLSPDYFAANFNTQLDPVREEAFQQWLRTEGLRRGKELGRELENYDLRGAWAAGAVPEPGLHGTDRYKKPNHPTFSDESIYHNTPSPFGEPWQGGHWSAVAPYTFTPSATMLENTHEAQALIDYFKRYEPKVKLILPNAGPTPPRRTR